MSQSRTTSRDLRNRKGDPPLGGGVCHVTGGVGGMACGHTPCSLSETEGVPSPHSRGKKPPSPRQEGVPSPTKIKRGGYPRHLRWGGEKGKAHGLRGYPRRSRKKRPCPRGEGVPSPAQRGNRRKGEKTTKSARGGGTLAAAPAEKWDKGAGMSADPLRPTGPADDLVGGPPVKPMGTEKPKRDEAHQIVTTRLLY